MPKLSEEERQKLIAEARTLSGRELAELLHDHPEVYSDVTNECRIAVREKGRKGEKEKEPTLSTLPDNRQGAGALFS